MQENSSGTEVDYFNALAHAVRECQRSMAAGTAESAEPKGALQTLLSSVSGFGLSIANLAAPASCALAHSHLLEAVAEEVRLLQQAANVADLDAGGGTAVELDECLARGATAMLALEEIARGSGVAFDIVDTGGFHGWR